MTQKPDKLDWKEEMEAVISRMLFLTLQGEHEEVSIILKDFIGQLLAKQKSETIEEIRKELKHIAMFDNGKFPKYLAKDVLDILDKLT